MENDQFGGRTDDDLFSDDFEPVAPEQAVIAPASIPAAAESPAEVAPANTQTDAAALATPAAAVSQPAEHVPQAPRSLALSRHNHNRPDKPARPSHINRNNNKADKADAQTASAPATTTAPPTAPKEPASSAKESKNTARATSAARLGSGANPRTKLTEEELAAKMEQMRILSAEKTRRFEQAQRDESEHAVALAKGMEEARRRRAEEALKRRAADEDRRRLEEERAKNRERKLHAMGMKEGGWDEGKEEQIREEERRSFRGAHGGVRGARSSGLAGSRYAGAADTADDSPATGDTAVSLRGRSGRRGNHRGIKSTKEDPRRGNGSGSHEHGDPPNPDEFPGLGRGPRVDLAPPTIGPPSLAPQTPLGPQTPISPPGNWDEEVAASVAAGLEKKSL